MNFTLFANEIIFPCLLFIFFSYFLIVAPELDTPNIVSKITTHQTQNIDPLERFFELILNDNLLQTELDNISDRQQLIDKLILIAASYGYYFLPSDIELAIDEHTASSQDNYICLPIGCWHIT